MGTPLVFILYCGLMICELLALLVIWNYSVQRKLLQSVFVATALTLVFVVAGVTFREMVPAKAYLAFAGMYIFSGLVWRWWKDGIAPDRWRASEVVLAVLATVMFSMASSALEQTA